MMRDAFPHHFDDPAYRWSAQLSGLEGRRREMVIKALRNSISSGFPADAEGVRILVAYAKGHISARQYVAQTLEALRSTTASYEPEPIEREPKPEPERWRAPARRPNAWSDPLAGPLTPVAPSRSAWRDSPRNTWAEPARESLDHQGDTGNTITRTRRATRRQAVQAYVSGQIPIEEFLRLTHVSTS